MTDARHPFRNADTFDPARLVADLEEKMRTAREKAAQVAAMEGWGEAADGRIKVCVGASGALKAVELDPRAMRLASEDLAAGILEAAALGQEAIAAQVREIYGPAEQNGGIDIAAATQGKADLDAIIEDKLTRARDALRR